MQPAKSNIESMTMDPRRSQLHENLPLDAPYSLHVFPTHYCNFKCAYCLHSLPQEKLDRLSFKKQHMPFSLYTKAIDDLAEFPNRLKALIFAGHGEPLIHPHLVEMVKYAKDERVADRVEIVTNASLLTPERSDRLIAAGLDRLRISVQGISREKYREVSGVNLDFQRFVENINYFYRHKVHTEVYIKIIDIALDNERQRELFHTLFSNISDITAIEYAIPFVAEIDHSRFKTDFSKCKQGHRHESPVCSMPFYMLVLGPDGSVLPCCNTEIPLPYGNIKENSLAVLWNGDVKRKFLHMQLIDRTRNPVCRTCTVPAFGLQEGDYLEEHAAALLRHYDDLGDPL
jgi:radical SAM protein with 4Fe4S-binding SPASM domain